MIPASPALLPYAIEILRDRIADRDGRVERIGGCPIEDPQEEIVIPLWVARLLFGETAPTPTSTNTGAGE